MAARTGCVQANRWWLGLYRETLPRTVLIVVGIIFCASTALISADSFQTKQQPTGPTGAAVSGETVESIDRKLAELESASADDAIKTKARELYQQAKQELEQQARWLKHEATFKKRVADIPERQRRAQLDESPVDWRWLAPPPDATVGELEKWLAEAQLEHRRLDELVKLLDEEPQRRNERRLEISRDLPTLKQQISELEAQATAEPDPAEPPLVLQARRALLQARLQARRSQLAAWEAELAAYEAEKDLLPLERTAARARLAAVAQAVDQLTKHVAAKRANEVERRRDRAVSQHQQSPPALKDEAQKNVQLSDQARQIAGDLTQAESETVALRNELSQWQDRISKSKRRAEKGHSLAGAAALRQDRMLTLERLSKLRASIATRNQTIAQLQVKLDELQEALDEVADPTTAAQRMAEERGFWQSPDEELALRQALTDILELRRQLLLDLTVRTTQYFEQLIELNDLSQDFLKELSEYAQYIDRRILWMRSGDPLSWRSPIQVLSALSDVGHQLVTWTRRERERWWSALQTELWDHALMHGIVLLAVAMLVRFQRALRERLAVVGQLAARGNCVQFRPTFEALFITGLISLQWPLLIAYVGWRLATNQVAAGYGLMDAALVFGPLELLRQTCRPRGLAGLHFGWPERSLQVMRRSLRWYAPTATGLVALVSILYRTPDGTAHDLLGRCTFLLLMFASSAAMHQIFRPRTGIFSEYLAFNTGGWADRLSVLWHPALALGPLCLAGLAAWGYYYTALQLAVCAAQTTAWTAVLVVLGGLLHRLLLLSRRRLAIQQAKQRQRMQGTSDRETPGTQDAPPDLAAINQQSRRLVTSALVLVGLIGAWLIWRDVLPALSVIQDIRIYGTGVTGDGTQQWVTLADLILALLIVVMTVIAARNIPGLLEIFLLQRLPFDSATRYALTTLSRYTITIAGIVGVCSTIGISWRHAQWLVAAVGVGLGFGLQEIFANFVSGIILLFERPIRVGDIITLGDVTGSVTRIRIRATTILDWDGKELIVPNKDLITGRLLNWTLSDTRNRIVIQVGVAYGTDVSLAQRLILEAAQNHPAVLKDPKPVVTFERFADSSLQLVLRAYLDRLDQRLPCINDLHLAINRAFQEHGISIPFPQMDVHIRDWATQRSPGNLTARIPGGENR